jgi:hypothetical protein
MQDLVTELQVARIVQWMLRPAAVALWLGTLIVPLHTQTAPPPPAPAQIKPAQIKDVQIPKLNTPPRLEQFLGGASRADLRRIDDFRQRQPGDGVPVSRKTSAWIGYDERNFYAVFVCDTPPGQTRARLAKREDIFSDDLVGVFFDTYHSGQRGYEFFVNPLGVQENIEASRIASKTKEAAPIGKFLRADAFERCAKRGKRRIGRLCVRHVCFYENVDVLRKAGLRVKNDSVTANNQVSNAMGMEGGQKVFVVLVHPVLSPKL